MPRKITLSCDSERNQREREGWRLYVSCFTSIHFKSEHFVAQSWNATAPRLGFPLCQTERKILWNLCALRQTKQGERWDKTAAYLYEGAFPSDLVTLVSSYSHLEATTGNNCHHCCCCIHFSFTVSTSWKIYILGVAWNFSLKNFQHF